MFDEQNRVSTLHHQPTVNNVLLASWTMKPSANRRCIVIRQSLGGRMVSPYYIRPLTSAARLWCSYSPDSDVTTDSSDRER